jgi:hypothetical protein
MTIYPVKSDGSVVTESYATLELFDVAELTGSCANYALSLSAAYDEGIVARPLNLSTACCSSGLEYGVLEGGVNRRMIVTNVTLPTFPDFLMSIIISLSDSQVDIQMPETPRILEAYNISYSPNKPKVDVNVYNWPWVTDEQPGAGFGDTYLQFFFLTSAKLNPPGNVTAKDFGQSFELAATTSNVDIRIDFLQVVNFDGVDMYSSVNEILDLNFEDVSDFAFPGILTMCDDIRMPVTPRYQNLSWDPTLSAIFISPEQSQAVQTPQQKKSNRTVAIAVGVTVSVVLVVCATLAVLFTKVPWFKSLLRR